MFKEWIKPKEIKRVRLFLFLPELLSLSKKVYSSPLISLAGGGLKPPSRLFFFLLAL
jgi:hypothetical protein